MQNQIIAAWCDVLMRLWWSIPTPIAPPDLDGPDTALVIDASHSMGQVDMPPTRLRVAQDAARAFVQMIGNGRPTARVCRRLLRQQGLADVPTHADRTNRHDLAGNRASLPLWSHQHVRRPQGHAPLHANESACAARLVVERRNQHGP